MLVEKFIMRFLITWLMISAFALPCGAAERKDSADRQRPRLIEQSIRSEERLYRTTPQGDLYLHLYFPPDWKRTDVRPAIVFFFGGGWNTGSYQQFTPQAEYFASRGLVAAAADYRIKSKHGTTPDQSVEDAKSAVRWLRSHAEALGVDPDRIIAAGGSAGGHLAAATALVDGFDSVDPADNDARVSCVPNALVLFNPVLNFTMPSARKFVDPAMRTPLSPALFLDESSPPAVLFFGTADKYLEHGENYAATAKKLGVRAELYLAPDMSHGFFNRSPWLEATVRKADEFLASLGYLAGPPTIETPEEASLKKR